MGHRRFDAVRARLGGARPLYGLARRQPDRSGHADRPGSPDAYRNGVADLAGGTGWRDPRARLGARRQELYRPAPQARARMTRSRGQTGASISAYRRSEEHTSELQPLMRHSYAVFCLKKKNHTYQVNLD